MVLSVQNLINQPIIFTDITKIRYEYEQKMIQLGLVEIQKELPQVKIDLKYATNDNFLQQNFYGEQNKAYTHPICLAKLKKAYQLLQEKCPGYSFIIYDATRSIEAQIFMWENILKYKPEIKEQNKWWYVANPYEYGSLHNYGMALDLSVIDDNGKVLNMGTNFDYFGKLAYPKNTNYFYNLGMLSKEIVENRELLFFVMKEAEFIASSTEWWHFSAITKEEARKNFKMYSIN